MSRWKGRRLAAPIALLLSLVLASPAQAVSWGADRTLTASYGGYAYPGGMAISSSTVVNVIYEQFTLGSFSVYVRRSTNSGTSWGTPVSLSRSDVGEAGVPSIDASGSRVDAVWVEGDDIFAGLDSIVVYRRSTDGGATWLDPVQLSPTIGVAGTPRVVHSGSAVAVAWTDHLTGKVWVRTSTDNGATFGAAITLGSTSNRPMNNQDLRESYVALGAGTGVLYAAWLASDHSLAFRRSTNGGASWATAKTLASNVKGFGNPSVAGNGSTVVVGYAAVGTNNDIWTAFRRSTDKGSSWAKAGQISPKSGVQSFAPVITYRGGAFRAVYELCTTNRCNASDTYYRSSKSGSTWSSASKASKRDRDAAWPADVDVAGKLLVLYVDYQFGTGGDVYVRQGA